MSNEVLFIPKGPDSPSSAVTGASDTSLDTSASAGERRRSERVKREKPGEDSSLKIHFSSNLTF